jgi:hypothetical protein
MPSKEQIIEFFESVGFKYEVITDSIYIDKRDVPLYFFQTDHKNHMVNCSTLMWDDAVRVYEKIHQTNVEIAFGRRCSKGHLMQLEARQCNACMKAYNAKKGAKIRAAHSSRKETPDA